MHILVLQTMRVCPNRYDNLGYRERGYKKRVVEKVSCSYPCELELFSLTVFFSDEAVTCCNGEGTGDECLLELESALISSSSSVGNFDIFFLFNPGTLLS